MSTTRAVLAQFLHSSRNHLRLRRYQRAIEQHDPAGYQNNAEYLLIETFFAMDRTRRDCLAQSFPWLNMYHTTFI